MNESQATVEQLRARIAELEAQVSQSDDELARTADAAGDRSPSPAARRTRSVFSAVLIVVALVLSPLAVISGTVKPLLSDTDAFVAAYAPLASDPRVQATVSNASINAINEAIDLETIAAELFDGLATLDLPPRAIAALELLEAPAVSGAQSLIDRAVTGFVASPQFADVWRQMLVVAHTQTVATMNASPDAAVSINDAGLVLNLRPIVAQVREQLVANGIGLAANIPDVDRTIQLAQSDALVTARVVYLVSVAVGTWLPPVTLIILALGIAIAVHRRATLVRAGVALGVIMLLVWLALTIGRSAAGVFVTAPALVPGVIETLYDATLANTVRASIAVGFVGFAAALAAWLGGRGRLASRIRSFASSSARSIRREAAKHHITTGAFGRALDRFHAIGIIVIIAVAVLALWFGRPLTIGFIVWTLVLALVAVFVLEVLRLPSDETLTTSEPELRGEPVGVAAEPEAFGSPPLRDTSAAVSSPTQPTP